MRLKYIFHSINGYVTLQWQNNMLTVTMKFLQNISDMHHSLCNLLSSLLNSLMGGFSANTLRSSTGMVYIFIFYLEIILFAFLSGHEISVIRFDTIFGSLFPHFIIRFDTMNKSDIWYEWVRLSLMKAGNGGKGFRINVYNKLYTPTGLKAVSCQVVNNNLLYNHRLIIL